MMIISFTNLRNTNHPNPCFEVNNKLSYFVKTDVAAISFSHRMELGDIKPDIVSFNILINCYCLLRQMKFAARFLRRAITLIS